MKFKKVLQAVALCGGLMGMGSTHAALMLFDSVNDTGSILYSTVHDGATLSATVNFTLNSLSARQAIFGVKVLNNSSGPGSNRLVSFGIDIVSPRLISASTNGGWDATRNTNFPSFSSVDLCIWDGSTCSGGGNQGVGEGLSESFDLTLRTLGDFTGGINFTSPYAVKFQSVGTRGNSIEFAGCIVGTAGCGPSQVPEPASIALVGLGLLGAALARRRKA